MSGLARIADSAGGKRPGARPGWDEQFSDYVRFVREHGRAPSQHAERANERALFYWLRNQRTSLRNGLLLPERRMRLEQGLPGWNVVTLGGDRRSVRNQSAWSTRLQQLGQHVRKHGRNPVVSPDVFPEEYALGKWLAIQRHAYRKGKLHPDREAQLNEVAPGWRHPKTTRAKR
jgi:Helicase associated domain